MASAAPMHTGSSSTKIGRKICGLQKLHSRAFRPHHGRFDIVDYLEEVLRLNWTAKSKEDRGILRKKTRLESGVRARKGKGTIHTIIEATAGSTPYRIRNRWVQALLYANKRRSIVKNDGLTKFLKANGGIAGCAAKMAKLRKPQQPTLRRPLESGW